MRYGFIHTDHLSSPISNLLLGHCRRRQQSTTSIFNLRSHIWGGWLGARIYNLHSPSPISTFWPCCCSERSAIHNLNLRSLVLNGEPDRTDLLARLGRVRVRDPLGSPVLIYYLYPNDLLVLRRDFHYSRLRALPGTGLTWYMFLLPRATCPESCRDNTGLMSIPLLLSALQNLNSSSAAPAVSRPHSSHL